MAASSPTPNMRDDFRLRRKWTPTKVTMPRIAEGDRVQKVRREMGCVAVCPHEVAQQIHAHRLQHAVVQVVPTATTGQLDVCRKPGSGRLERTQGGLEPLGLTQP